MSDKTQESGKPDVQIITPPHLIKSKVSGSGGPSPAMLAKAEAAISQMSSDYPTWALKDVDRLETMIKQAEPGLGNGRERMQESFKLVHDMRGQGGSFGFPLITRIARSYCRFVESLENVDPGALEICQAHANAMRAVLLNNVTGSGGSIGTQIADGLEKAVQKHCEKRAKTS